MLAAARRGRRSRAAQRFPAASVSPVHETWSHETGVLSETSTLSGIIATVPSVVRAWLVNASEREWSPFGPIAGLPSSCTYFRSIPRTNQSPVSVVAAKT
jgi:hypothetical protein